jgi:hypothetical protein
LIRSRFGAFVLRRLPVAIGLLIVLSPAIRAAASPVFPLEEVRPGMEGVARTVFEGDAIEEFRVEILGILRNAIGPQQDMILARLHGERVEFTGVVAGMSGSPVYIDGKIVGAVSYLIGNFAKEPIAGITPIGDMLRLAEVGSGDRVAAVGRSPDMLEQFLEMMEPGAAQDPGRAPAPGGETIGRPASTAGRFEPIGTPLVCTGCDPGVLRYYAPIFEAHGLEPMAGGGATGEPSTQPLEPGSPIAAALVFGDLGMTGIGTLTEVVGDQVFAFGHPLLGTGPTQVPMTRAEVILTFASSAASFKVANATQPIGSIVRDGLTAVVGEIGRVAPTIPVEVSVTSPSDSRSFHYQIMDHRGWSPVLVAMTTANSLVRTTEYDASATLALRYRIDLEGYPEVEFEELYSGVNPSQPVHTVLANAAGGLFGLLHNNPFEIPHMRGARLDIEVLPETQVAVIGSLSASRTLVRPGETFAVTAILEPFRGAPRTVVWNVTMPGDMPRGNAQIVVGSGPAIASLEKAVLQKRVIQAGNLADLIAVVETQRKSHSLYLSMTRRSPSAVVRSEILPDLPLSIFSVLNNPRLSTDTTLMFQAPILELEKDFDLVVVGGRRISVKVK